MPLFDLKNHCLILESFRDRAIKAEDELARKSREVTALAKQLENKSKHNALLEESLRHAQECFEESTRIKDKKIAALTSELDAKAGNIAYLTKQLHDSKVAYAKLNEAFSSISPTGIERPMISPAPPGEKAPASTRKRYVRKVVASNGSVDIESLPGLNPTSQKMLLNVKAGRNTDNVPIRSTRRTPTPKKSRLLEESPIKQARNIPNDYAEFLKTGSKPEQKLVFKTAPNPLPPIMDGASDSGNQFPYKLHRSRGKDSGIVDEIIISPLNSPDKSWRQGSNQYDPVS